MTRRRVPFRLAFGVSLLALIALAAAATVLGYLVEAHVQHSGRSRDLSSTATYVKQGLPHAETVQWQQALDDRLAAHRLSAELWLVTPPARRAIFASKQLVEPEGKGVSLTIAPSTETYRFPVAGAPSEKVELDLYAQPLDRTRRVLVALVCGLAALLIAAALLLWGANRWLVAPLRRLSAQVDAIAGGDPVEARAGSPIREVENVAVAVTGMADRLAQTAERDARVDAERRFLVSSIAHDLRTPLFSLRGYLDAIATGVGDPHDRLDRARAKGRQIDRLITRLFDYARAELDEPPRLEETDLAAAVAETTAAFELAADGGGVALRLGGRAAGPVPIDRDGFDRALANVIDNALRHTPRGGAVDVIWGDDGDGAFVRVVDDGPGIDADLLPRVFEPMVRADGSRNGRTGGTGLGLTIAERLLRAQGATIEAANAPGRGAAFTLRLPRLPGAYLRDITSLSNSDVTRRCPHEH